MSSEPNLIRLRQDVSRRILAVKIAKAREILSSGDSVVFELAYRPHEATLEEPRLRLFGRISFALKDIAVAETMPEEAGKRTMTMMLRPT